MPRVLIIDDAVVTRKLLRKILDPEGYEIIEADNGQTGLDAIDEHKPDCIITDMLMPMMDGLGLLQALEDRGNKIPVLVLTADVQESIREDCKKLNCFGVLNKPYNHNELLKLVNKMLALNSKSVV